MKYLWIALAAGGLVAGCGVDNKTENPQQVAESAAPSLAKYQVKRLWQKSAA